jgi:hypothetical protein
MACRNTYKRKTVTVGREVFSASAAEPIVPKNATRLFFGVDSEIQADDHLQNNLEQFDWVVRNKIYPNFYGRHLTGDNCLTKEEIRFLHSKGCKIAAIYACDDEKKTEEQGTTLARKMETRASELGIPEGTAIFLEIGENEVVTRDFMRGLARALLIDGYTPAFRANTDAKFCFDREFSRGMQSDKEIFKRCLIWAISPTVKEYDAMTTTHLIHPDNWGPYAPSAISRSEIAIWQYGKNCHPIEDDNGQVATFHLDLVRNDQVIIDKMF